jgi:L-aspartate oxidase
MNRPETTDFLIVGGGVAGLRAAIGAARHGSVLLLHKGTETESSSQKAQGGIAAVLNAEEGETESHYQDTLDAGHGLCRSNAVRLLVEEGPARVAELIEWGAQFDKIGSRFATALEGAHRKSRVLRAHGDATGGEIVRALVAKARSQTPISLLANTFAIDLIIQSGVCQGVWVMNERTRRIYPVLARGVVLATGGAGQLFSRTTNPLSATGDGLGMAIRAGALLEDMEFVQFHPTALFLPRVPPFLLSEAMRGEGAQLVDDKGKPFMSAYHPDGELAPRDIVTRAIFNEMQKGHSVFLRLTHLQPAFTRERFPTIYATCMGFGIDITRMPIPIAPAAHYMMGGIKTTILGRTNVGGLWATGEVAATGVHGANRLASNALLEGLVFGARVGDDLARIKLKQSFRTVPKEEFTKPHSAKTYLQIQKELKEILWNEVGINRSALSLDRAMQAWARLNEATGIKAPASRLGLETRNMVMAGYALISAARKRKASLGAHFREDSIKENRPPRHALFKNSSMAIPPFLRRKTP